MYIYIYYHKSKYYISEFDKWYSESFLSTAEGELHPGTDAGYGTQSGFLLGKSHEAKVSLHIKRTLSLLVIGYLFTV
jgi:hypothetical protein